MENDKNIKYLTQKIDTIKLVASIKHFIIEEDYKDLLINNNEIIEKDN